MFGYVRPLKGDLLVKEYDAYKAVYCTLCKEMGEHYGVFSRLSLSYDMTYYAILALDLSGETSKVRRGKCVVNPAKKCNFICEGCDIYKKAAALTVLMTYHKLRDNISDESFLKKNGARAMMIPVKGPMKKAAQDYPFFAQVLQEMMEAQTAVEKEENPSIDACCEPTAAALSKIFAELAGEDRKKEVILSQLGYFFGRWVYTMDAADDLEKDLEEGAFNPFIKKLGLEGCKEIPAERKKEIENECNSVLNSNVAMINSAVNLLDLGDYKNIIENVSMKGMAEVQREILFLHVHAKNKREPDKIYSEIDEENK